jgi:hypothetical protein
VGYSAFSAVFGGQLAGGPAYGDAGYYAGLIILISWRLDHNACSDLSAGMFTTRFDGSRTDDSWTGPAKLGCATLSGPQSYEEYLIDPGKY